MSAKVQRSIRLESKTSAELNRFTANRGEIFYDSSEDTLRIYDGKTLAGFPLLRADLSNIAGGGSGAGDVDFGTKVVKAGSFEGDLTGNVSGNLTGNVTGQVSDISNHALDSLSNVDVSAATSGQVLYYTGSNWQATTLSSSFNGGNVGGITNFLNALQSTNTTTGGVVVSGGLGVGKNINVGGSAAISGSLALTNGLTIATNKFTVDYNNGNTVIAGSLQTGSTISVNSDSAIRFYDIDNTNFIGLKAPTNVSTDLTFTLPGSDGEAGQVLQTNGLGEWSWATVSGGGGGGGSTPPGGSNTQVQFNNNGSFAGDSDFTFNITTNTLSVSYISAVTITSALTGDVEGNVTGNVTGDVEGNVTGDLTGNVSGNVSGNVTSTGSSSFSSATITGGSINNTPIGNTTKSSGGFTTVTATGDVSATSGTDSTSTTTGAVKVAGGIGVTLNANIGGSMTVNNDVTVGGNLSASQISVPTAPVAPTDATNKSYVDKRSIALSIALGS